MHILQVMRMPLFSRPILTRPHNRIRSDNFLKMETDSAIFACVIILLYSSTFICGWNFYLPTTIERILWRYASVYYLVFALVGGGYVWLWDNLLLPKYIIASSSRIQRSLVEPKQHRGIKRIKYRIGALTSKIRIFYCMVTQISIFHSPFFAQSLFFVCSTLHFEHTS
jgi:hypothetical protein